MHKADKKIKCTQRLLHLKLILFINRGNIVIARDKEEHAPFRLLGEDKHVKSFGVHVSLIDFTLSRLDTGFNTEHPKRGHSFCHVSRHAFYFSALILNCLVGLKLLQIHCQ